MAAATDSTNPGPPRSFVDVVDAIDDLGHGQDEVEINAVLARFGTRYAAPILVVCGTVIVIPITGAIPGVPIAASAIVALIIVEMLISRRWAWVPRFLGERKLPAQKVRQVMRAAKPVAKAIDRITRHRLTWLVEHVGVYLIAALSLLIALTTPMLELIPYSAAIAGSAYVAFGLALLVHDGLIALIAIACSGSLFWLVGAQFLS